MSIHNILFILSFFCCALIAGLLYGYSCSVNPGLAKLNDRSYIDAMQNINAAILNPLFFLSFFGTTILIPITTVLHKSSSSFPWLLAASLIYLLGVLGVTMFGNVPLNNALSAFKLEGASLESIKDARTAFENSWNRFHTIRTIAAGLSLLILVFAFIKSK